MDHDTRLDILEKSMAKTEGVLGTLTHELSNIGELIKGVRVSVDNNFSLIKLEIENKLNNVEAHINNQIQEVKKEYVTKEELEPFKRAIWFVCGMGVLLILLLIGALLV